MRHRSFSLSIVLQCLLVVSSVGAEFSFGELKLTAPKGFVVERVAGPPLVDRPICADFDERGRLYVADSSGSNDKVEKQLAEKPHRIVRLEDTNGDGTFDKQTVFADKMMFPEGAMWLDGSLYVGAPPSIWKLTDTDDDGVADKREEWFKGKTLTGCANDLHGPYLGPDGWIYWCKGAFAPQTYEIGTNNFKTRAAHIFRCRPDGSGIEPVMTGGMDNPVEVAFSAGGERFFTTTFFQNPEGGRRDGLVHAIYGGVYGKVHDVIDEHPTTGEVMPVLTNLGAAAPAGLTRFQSGQFGWEYENNLFAALFNLHKVTRHELIPNGATYKTRDTDFLSSDHADFHPTDVIEDADGSLLVIDTGGWYKLCCPTSQLPKPDVLGAIYRVRRTDAKRVNDPRGLKLSWRNASANELSARLKDLRPAVRTRAIDELGKQGSKAVPALTNLLAGKRSSSKKNAAVELESVWTRNAIIWALHRIDSPAARAAVRRAMGFLETDLRLAAIHSASLWRDRDAVPELLGILQVSGFLERRAAAEALGRIGDAGAVPDIYKTVVVAGEDRVLQHSLTYALMEIGDWPLTEKGLTSNHPWIERAALFSLAQMKNSALRVDDVARFLNSPHDQVKSAARLVAGRRPQWSAALADWFSTQLHNRALSQKSLDELSQLLAGFAKEKTMQAFLARLAADAEFSDGSREVALNAMARSSAQPVPTAWFDSIASVVTSKNPALIPAAIRAARAIRGTNDAAHVLNLALMNLAQDSEWTEPMRIDALSALGKVPELDPTTFGLVFANVANDKPIGVRSVAAQVLTRTPLTAAQFAHVAVNITNVGPMELLRVLDLFEKQKDAALGKDLVSALAQHKALSPAVLQTARARLAGYPIEVREALDQLTAKSGVPTRTEQKASLDRMVTELKGGDVRRGQAVFASQKAACAACHAIGYLGGKVGPDLTNIGQVRTDFDLLESIIHPSLSFVRSYEPVTVVTTSGEEQSGVIRKDAADEVILATGPTTEARIPRSQIAQIQPGSLSIMPEGLAEQLSKQELADLLAFLRNTRWGAE